MNRNNHPQTPTGPPVADAVGLRVVIIQTLTGPPVADAVRFMGDAVRFEEVKWETIKGNPSMSAGNPSASAGPDGVAGRIPNPTNHFSHFFNTYAKYINNKYNRHGSLFQLQVIEF